MMFGALKKIWNRHRGLVIVLGLAVVAGVTFGGVRFSRAVPVVPTAIVQRGEFIETVQFRGHVIAEKSVLLKAPS